jgi:2-deoxy-D-gluconate 3-dehydrogenase
LVNNAGIGANHPALEVTKADWDEMMSVNLKGLFFCCHAAAKLMLPRSFGRTGGLVTGSTLSVDGGWTAQ